MSMKSNGFLPQFFIHNFPPLLRKTLRSFLNGTPFLFFRGCRPFDGPAVPVLTSNPMKKQKTHIEPSVSTCRYKLQYAFLIYLPGNKGIIPYMAAYFIYAERSSYLKYKINRPDCQGWHGFYFPCHPCFNVVPVHMSANRTAIGL